MSKRKVSAALGGQPDDRNTKPRLDADQSSSFLAFPNTSQAHQRKAAVPFQKPTQIMSFSYPPSHIQEFTNSSLRYYVDPPLGANLGYGYDRWIRRPDEKGRLDSLLRAYTRAEDSGTCPVSLNDIAVVCWRGVMTRILTAPYEEREGWEMNVMRVNGTMYFEEQLSAAKLEAKNKIEPRHRKFMYYGYAFESYSTSSTCTRPPVDLDKNDPPGWSGDVDTNVQWCSVVRTKLGDQRMVLGGEVDCARAEASDPKDGLVELKTSLVIRGPHDEANFEKKLLKFYFQSFLLGVPEVVVGFRTPSGELRSVQSFKTIEMPRLVRGKPGAWDPLTCLEWAERLLTFLKEMTGGQPDDRVWRVKFIPKEGVRVEVLDRMAVTEVVGQDEEMRMGFLPGFYWERIHGNKDQ